MRNVDIELNLSNLKTGVSRKQSTPNFPKNENFLPPDTHTNLRVTGGKKCLFFGKFGVLCFSWNFCLITDDLLVSYISDYQPSLPVRTFRRTGYKDGDFMWNKFWHSTENNLRTCFHDFILCLFMLHATYNWKLLILSTDRFRI